MVDNDLRDLDDRELMARHVAGDGGAAFGELFRRHRDRMYAVAVRTTGQRELAADSVQDAFISAYRRAAGYRGEAAVTTWLHRIVVNACLDRLRREKVTVRRAGDLGELDLPDKHDHHASVEARLDVQAALARIPEAQRLALTLVDMHGLSIAEAATVLGVAEGTVKSRCFRGRAALAVILRPADERAGDSGPVASASIDAGSVDVASASVVLDTEPGGPGDVTPTAGRLRPNHPPPRPAPKHDPCAPEDLVRDRDDDTTVEHDPTGIRDLLARLPEPGPMPEDLVARITASLAEEARTAGSPGNVVGARVLDLPPPRRSRWPLLGVAAAVVAVLGLGGLVMSTMPGGLTAALNIGSNDSADSAGSAAEPAPAAGGADAARGDVVVTSTGTVYETERMSVQAAALATSTDPPVPPDTGLLAPVSTPAGARSCADGLGVATDADLLVDVSIVGDRPAAVLLVSATGGRTVYAVQLSCSAQNPEVIAGPMPVTP